jgi:glycosyltransferase 2 family protein
MSESPSLLRKLLPRIAISLALAALFVWLLWRGGVPLLPDASAFRAVQWWAVPGYAALVGVTHFFRASRWRFLIAPVKKLPFREVIALNWIGFFAIFALPLRLGEVARPALGKMRAGVSISAGFGTVAVERVIDGLITSLCVVWALLAIERHPTEDPIAQKLPIYGYASVAIFATAFVALGLFLWQRTLAAKLVAKTVGLVSAKMGRLLSEKVGSVADGVRSIAEPRLAFPFLAESLVYWGTNAAGMWLLGVGCGLPMSFSHAIAVMGILAIGILLPAGPGLFGNFQFAISLALKLYFAGAIVGAAGSVYIFLMYATQAILIVVAGIVPLYVMRIPFGALLGNTRE